MAPGRRRVLALSILIVLVLVGIEDFLLQRVVRQQYRFGEVTRVQNQIGFLRAALEETILGNLLRVEATAAYVAVNPDLSAAEFNAFAAQLIRDAELRNIGAAPGFRIEYVYPLAGNEALLGVNYRELPEQWPRVQESVRLRSVVVDGPLDLVQGGRGLVARVPVFLEGEEGEQLWGIVAALLDFESINGQVAALSEEYGLRFAIREPSESGHTPIYGDQDIFADELAAPADLRIAGRRWQLTAVPRDGWRVSNPFRLVIHGVSMFIAVALIGIVWLKLRRDERVQAAERSGREQMELFFGQSLYGAFFASLPGPVPVAEGALDEDYIVRTMHGETLSRVNDAMVGLYGSSREAMETRSFAGLFDEPDSKLLAMWQSMSRDGRYRGELRYRSASGEQRLVEGYYRPVLNQGGEIIGHFGLQHDVTDEREAKGKLDRYIRIVDANVITSQTDLDGRMTYASSAFCRISGYSQEELLGADHNIIRHPEVSAEQYADLWNTLRAGRIWKGEMQNLTRDGETYWVQAEISPLFDRNGERIGYMSVQQDISAQKTIERMSETDPLTGIANRLYLDGVLENETNRFARYGHPFAVLLLDIDHFKPVNDTFGHLAGDEVLKGVARILRERIRETDRVGRWGGEEFLVVCPHTDQAGALELAEELRREIEAADFPVDQTVTVSIGLAVAEPGGHEGENSDRIIAVADSALYQAKRSGRNRVCMLDYAELEQSDAEGLS